MKEVKTTTNFIIKWVITIISILVPLLLLFFDSESALGILIGGIMGIFNLYLLSFSLNKSVEFNPLQARVYMIIQYLFRYGLWFFIFYVVLKNQSINLFTTIAGMLIVKVVIFSINLFDFWPQHENKFN